MRPASVWLVFDGGLCKAGKGTIRSVHASAREAYDAARAHDVIDRRFPSPGRPGFAPGQFIALQAMREKGTRTLAECIADVW